MMTTKQQEKRPSVPLSIPLRTLLIGSALGLGAGVAYGFAQVITRHVTTTLVAPQVAVVYSVIFGILGMTIVAARQIPRDIKAPKRNLAFVFLAGVAGSVGLFFLYLALSRAPVSLVSPVVATVPLFSLVFSYLFLKTLERVTLRIILGAALVVLGVVLIVLGG